MVSFSLSTWSNLSKSESSLSDWIRGRFIAFGIFAMVESLLTSTVNTPTRYLAKEIDTLALCDNTSTTAEVGVTWPPLEITHHVITCCVSKHCWGGVWGSRYTMEKVAKFCEHWCSPSTPATVFCQQCKTAFCKECDHKMHQGKRQKHSRQSYKHQPEQQQCTGEAAAVASTTLSSHFLIDAKEDLLVGKVCYTNCTLIWIADIGSSRNANMNNHFMM